MPNKTNKTEISYTAAYYDIYPTPNGSISHRLRCKRFDTIIDARIKYMEYVELAKSREIIGKYDRICTLHSFTKQKGHKHTSYCWENDLPCTKSILLLDYPEPGIPFDDKKMGGEFRIGDYKKRSTKQIIVKDNEWECPDEPEPEGYAFIESYTPRG